MKITHILLIILLVWNIIVFAVYGADKLKAKRGSWRVSEKTLMLMALFFGGTGALIGMGVFRHKTKHRKFSIGVPLLTLLNYACIGAALWLLNR